MNPEDSYARVELYRWQHGELPPQKRSKELDESVAISRMTDALEAGIKEGDMSKAPAPHNLVAVLRYIARTRTDKFKTS